jgi:hypothetical protein
MEPARCFNFSKRVSAGGGSAARAAGSTTPGGGDTTTVGGEAPGVIAGAEGGGATTTVGAGAGSTTTVTGDAPALAAGWVLLADALGESTAGEGWFVASPTLGADGAATRCRDATRGGNAGTVLDRADGTAPGRGAAGTSGVRRSREPRPPRARQGLPVCRRCEAGGNVGHAGPCLRRGARPGSVPCAHARPSLPPPCGPTRRPARFLAARRSPGGRPGRGPGS